MNIGLDLDNTLIYTNIVQDTLDEYGRELPSEVRTEILRRFKLPEYNCYVPALKGVKRSLNIWKRLGYKLIVITARPSEIEKDTIDMVKRLFPVVDKVIVVSNKEKKQTLVNENIDVFVDDAGHFRFLRGVLL
ncbi:MAG: hypothetical protein WC260_01465 [Candidatus Pacearchaeota archaeon]